VAGTYACTTRSGLERGGSQKLRQWRAPITRELTGEATGGVTGEVTGEVQRLVLVLDGRMRRVQIQHALGLRHEDHFRESYLTPALQSGFVEMTVPGKPKSGRQEYRLTEKGQALRAKLPGKKDV
jgi:hypothetical protein